MSHLAEAAGSPPGVESARLFGRVVIWRGKRWTIAGAEDTPPAGDPPSGDPPAGDPPSGDPPPAPTTGETVSKAEFDRVVKESAAYRRRAQAAEQKVSDAETAQLSETDRLKKQLAEAEAARDAARTAQRAALIRAAIEREASSQGAVKADVVYRLVDQADIELDDETGEVKGAARAVKALLEAEPYLKAQDAGTGPGGRPLPPTPRPGTQPTHEQLVDQAVEKMRAAGASPF